MKTYRLRLRNHDWLYSVYRSDDDEYLLVAVVPWIMWFDLAALLDEAEVETFETDIHAFTDIVNDFLKRRDQPPWRDRRVESRLHYRKPFDPDVIDLRP